MSDDKPDPPRKKRKPRNRRRRLQWHFGFWSLLALGLGVGFLVLTSMSLTGRVVSLPNWVKDRVETRMNDQMEIGSVSLGRIEFGMTPRGYPRLRLNNLRIRDGTGLEIAQLNGVEGGVKPLPLLRGQVEPSVLYLSGAQVTLRRRANGEFDLSFGQGGGASGDLASVLDAIDKAFTSGPLSRAERIEADALTITLEDARSGRLWQVTDGHLKLEQTEKIVDITVTFDVFNQTEELAEIVMGFRSAKGSSEASFGTTFRNAAAADIAAQSPVLSFLGVVDAPISGALRTTIDEDGAISDLAGTLELGTGALSPAPGARPVKFDGAKVYIDYDPAYDRVGFSGFSMTSEPGVARGEGYAYLRDYNNGWPAALLGQFKLTEAQVNPRGFFKEPVQIDGGAIDFRLRLDPFTVDLGQVVLSQGGNTYEAHGQISAGRDGWDLALSASTDHLTKAQVLALWPLELAPNPRAWVDEFILDGTATNARAAFRLAPGQAPKVSVGADFSDVSARVVQAMAPIEGASGYLSIEDQTFTVVTEQAHVVAPSGAELQAGGSVFQIPIMATSPTPATVDLQVAGPVGGALSLLAAKPYEIFRNSELGPDLATGEVLAQGRLNLTLKPVMLPEDVLFDVTATLRQVQSSILIPNKVLAADTAQLHATHAGIEITGDARIGQVSAGGSWSQVMGPEADGRSKVDGWVELSQNFLDEFNIGLPENAVTGQGVGRITIDLSQGAAPQFSLLSDLNRIGIRIPDLGWSKARNRTGRLFAQGSLGETPSIDVLEFEAPGLTAKGRVSVTPGGGLQEARFDRVKLGGWLDAPVTFTGRGAGKAPGITVSGGSADLRKAEFSSGSGGGSDAPIRLNLDRLSITEGIVLTGFAGDFSRRGGLNGTFSARVGGGPAIKGTLAPQPNGSAFRLTSADAGGVLRAAGVFRSAQGGNMVLILTPRKGEGVYEGDLKITDVRVKDAPALAGLLSAVSVVGILEQLDGQGLSFPEVDARFNLSPGKVTVYRSSAVGPSLGLSMDGTYDLNASQLDMQGVLSPLYLVNAIGQIFTRKGEGLIGFNFTLKGTPDAPRVGVNPLSIFTPGMFREIFRRPPPKQVE